MEDHTILHTYPSGKKEYMFPEDLCKCKKYKHMNDSIYCIECDPTSRPPANKPPKKSNKK